MVHLRETNQSNQAMAIKMYAGDSPVKIESNGPYHISVEIDIDEEDFFKKNDLHSDEEFSEVKKDRDAFEEQVSEWSDKVDKLDNEIADLREHIKQLEEQLSKLEDQ